MKINIDNKDNIYFNIKNKNNNFDIKLSLKNEQLYFSYENKNDNSSKQKIFIFEELQIISKLFSIYDNINEIFESIKDIILNSKINKKYPDIIIRDKEEYFVINVNFGKYKCIEFPLNSEPQKNIVKIDYKILNEIEDDMKIFDSFVDTYEKKIKNLKNKNKQLKFENYKEKMSNNNFYYYNINNSYEHFVLIQSRYKPKNFNELLIFEKDFYICNLIIQKFKNKKLYFNLIYKATIDGDKAQNFHNRVDGKGPLIVLVKTRDNITIGGYTSVPWSSSNECIIDSDAFLFSLDKKEKYKNINPNYACHHYECTGPYFGNFELNIVDNCFKEYSYTNFESNYNYFEFKDINLIGEKNLSSFIVNDYEVYQVIVY